jgi:membrane protein implicated in regulation of membrane protease activity
MVIVALALIFAIALFVIGVGWSTQAATLQWFGLNFQMSGRWLLLTGILATLLFLLALRLLRQGLARNRKRRRELKDFRTRERETLPTGKTTAKQTKERGAVKEHEEPQPVSRSEPPETPQFPPTERPLP